MLYVKKCRKPPEDEPKPFQVKRVSEGEGETSRHLGEGGVPSSNAFKEEEVFAGERSPKKRRSHRRVR